MTAGSKTVLRIDASARTRRSITRELADSFVSAWCTERPGDVVLSRDVGRDPPPAVSEEWIAAAFSKTRTSEQEAALAVSDRLIDEVEAADVLVLATPMYNYGMPASLKAWFDQVIRVGRTFTFDLARGDHPLEPILDEKTLVVLSSVGEFGFAIGGPNAAHGHLLPHIRTASKYLGVGDRIHTVEVEYQEFGDERHAASRRQAMARVPDLARELASGRVEQ
jgi:FMN-dependent NADH-azoreductase